MDVSIVLTMLAVGLILGFVGAGGSGFIISILTLLYGVSVHVALATALTAMIFSSLSGAVSHYREGNVSLKSGISVGILGALGAWIGSNLSSFILEGELKWLTAGMLLLSGVLLWLRMFLFSRQQKERTVPTGAKFVVYSLLIGLITGALSGMFGIDQLHLSSLAL